ncbi:MAG: hypothetical protein ACXVJ2_04585, partial [Candidatus Angelobacter sp.]
MLRQFETTAAAPSGKAPQVRHDQVAPDHVLLHWVNTQALNLTRHAAALRPFKRDEFGSISAAPTAGHIEAVNKLITGLRRGLLNVTGKVNDIARVASRKPATGRLQLLVDRKEKAHNWVQGIEKIWDFYFELFGQRQTRYANWLLSCDRIALDCYRAAYLGLGVARSIPAPPPFSYMRTGFSP